MFTRQGRLNFIPTVILAMLGALVLSGPAMAQTSPTTQVYGGDQGEVLGSFQGGDGDQVPPPSQPEVESDKGGGDPAGDPVTRVERGANTPAAATAGSLPFTGFESAMLAMVGIALVGAGFGIRRLARQG